MFRFDFSGERATGKRRPREYQVKNVYLRRARSRVYHTGPSRGRPVESYRRDTRFGVEPVKVECNSTTSTATNIRGTTTTTIVLLTTTTTTIRLLLLRYTE